EVQQPADEVDPLRVRRVLLAARVVVDLAPERVEPEPHARRRQPPEQPEVVAEALFEVADHDLIQPRARPIEEADDLEHRIGAARGRMDDHPGTGFDLNASSGPEHVALTGHHREGPDAELAKDAGA